MDPREAFLQAAGLSTSPYAPGSRYHGLALHRHRLADGTVVAYSERRFLPRTEDLLLLREYAVEDGDRLDQIAARLLGDPGLNWRLCDANPCLHPSELTEVTGRPLRITLPEGMAGGRDAG